MFRTFCLAPSDVVAQWALRLKHLADLIHTGRLQHFVIVEASGACGGSGRDVEVDPLVWPNSNLKHFDRKWKQMSQRRLGSSSQCGTSIRWGGPPTILANV